jgi:hypothetical protein
MVTLFGSHESRCWQRRTQHYVLNTSHEWGQWQYGLLGKSLGQQSLVLTKPARVATSLAVLLVQRALALQGPRVQDESYLCALVPLTAHFPLPLTTLSIAH